MATSGSADPTIVRAAIHPGIGIARIGNARDAFYIGPQVPNPAPLPPEHYRDDTGALKREAALFRIYGYNAAGEVVAELTADMADITWHVHVANQKSGWYQFHVALDSEQALTTVDSSQRAPALRNAGIAAVLVYLAADHWLAPAYGNHGVWAAFLIFYVARGATLAAAYPALERRLYSAPTASETEAKPSE